MIMRAEGHGSERTIRWYWWINLVDASSQQHNGRCSPSGRQLTTLT
uniref:Uncharacterized protein n=1 Tax=Zea mays TaxID=4577 RepID=B6T7F0_MAIZE|nr:hypothetical protein [Zea mays]